MQSNTAINHLTINEHQKLIVKCFTDSNSMSTCKACDFMPRG